MEVCDEVAMREIGKFDDAKIAGLAALAAAGHQAVTMMSNQTTVLSQVIPRGPSTTIPLLVFGYIIVIKSENVK